MVGPGVGRGVWEVEFCQVGWLAAEKQIPFPPQPASWPGTPASGMTTRKAKAKASRATTRDTPPFGYAKGWATRFGVEGASWSASFWVAPENDTRIHVGEDDNAAQQGYRFERSEGRLPLAASLSPQRGGLCTSHTLLSAVDRRRQACSFCR